MKRVLVLLGIVLLIFCGVLAYALVPTHTRLITRSSAADAASIERGRYLAVAGDCTACHTAPGGQAFAGGLPLGSPVGTIYSTNITPDKKTGIGTYTLDDFDRAVRHGIDQDGGTLYPAMPYPSYARLTDADVTALYDYFMQAVAPVVAEEHENGIPWPLSIHWPLALWRKLFASEIESNRSAFDASRYSDAETARGAYLVQGLGHCGSCHTPRSVTFKEKALDDSSTQFLAGGQVIDGWVAVNLRGNAADGLGSWSQQDIVATLRSGRNDAHAVVGQPMNDVVVHSTQLMSDADLNAVAKYLKTLSPAAADGSGFKADPASAKALAAGHELNRGAEVYVDNCAACHRSNGEGSAKVLPAIAGNPSVLAPDPSSLIRLVLAGSSLPGTATAPSALGMPGFAWRLSNDEVAQLLTFIRSSWGNQAPAVSAGAVGKVRAVLDRASSAGTP
jgi:alcohol dehydrogenase (quinone), cytochrome c subunit